MIHSAERIIMAKTEQVTGAAALEAARREKLHKLEEMGIDPWGQRFDGAKSIGSIRAREAEIKEIPAEEEGKPSQYSGPQVCAAGRIILMRPSGKVIWMNIRDKTGMIQVMIGKSQIGEENFLVAKCLDLGDLIAVEGEFVKTRTGELTIFASKLTFLTKCLTPPPEKFHGLTDPELCQRQRYVDLAYGEGTMDRFLRRSAILKSLRQTLDEEGFTEVEGPTLHAIAGGAAAKPFVTHHNALDIDLYLRIALELHLKRLLVGGMERVYEIGRVYRNEGIDIRHNPEFTLTEIYQAYGNYESMMDLTEKLIVNAIKATGQSFILPWKDGELNFTPPFARRKYYDLVAENTGVDPHDNAAMAAYAKSIGLETAGKHPDVILNEVFEEKVESTLEQPTFVYDYPASICPLTKRNRENPNIAERFEMFVKGMELANAYTELNDPDLQEKLFSSQLEGLPEEESMAKMDNDFIRALRNGMPPAGGLGIGIDRLVMLLTNSQSIRDIILFPLLKPEINP